MEFKFKNVFMIHARVAYDLAFILKKIEGKTEVKSINNIVNGKSIMSLLLLNAPIGSEIEISKLKSGNGLFKRSFGNNGKKVFDNYWINYETKGMAKEVGRDNPKFKNLETYLEWVKSLNS